MITAEFVMVASNARALIDESLRLMALASILVGPKTDQKRSDLVEKAREKFYQATSLVMKANVDLGHGETLIAVLHELEGKHAN